ncbi:GH21137 [Drosophila grimshawi]|uniref:GH21137 n=1 Tax=Drosophila grimshawi TaxID=7222 RepID=B4J6B8_DROGR|nr:GH21137 [Drosophila grimshawi]
MKQHSPQIEARLELDTEPILSESNNNYETALTTYSTMATRKRKHRNRNGNRNQGYVCATRQNAISIVPEQSTRLPDLATNSSS